MQTLSISERIALRTRQQAIVQGTELSWNTEQQAAIELASKPDFDSFCLTGAAGTGKSTVTAEILKPLISRTRLSSGTKYLQVGSPGVAIVAFTRRAANNIRKMCAPQLKGNVLTIHKLLEFTKNIEKVFDIESGQFKNKVTFFPARDELNTLPESLKLIVIDESSTLGMRLWKQLEAAAPHCKFIFIGDINQLPPVGDDSVFGCKLEELPTVELTQVYRQALESKPLALAHRILSGKAIYTKELKEEWSSHPDLQIHIFPKGTHSEDAMLGSVGALKKLWERGEYDPENDIVLTPFNKWFGTLEMNKWILDFAYQDRLVHEVIAGYDTLYIAVGDMVLFNKEEYIVVKVNRNASYKGRQPVDTPCDRWGRLKKGLDFRAEAGLSNDSLDLDMDDIGIEFNIDSLADGVDDKVNQASHILHLKSIDAAPDAKDTLVSTAGDMNNITFAHCTTIHKAQGSGWSRVFLFLHSSHAKTLSRELLYTAVTRVKGKLTIFCEGDTFVKGINQARIPGTTAAEKAKYFKGKNVPKETEDKDEVGAEA